jgi:hypothetical protein
MSTDEDEPPEWVTGPPEGYDPPPIDDLRDPEVRTRTHARGADLVRQVLADCGIRKRDGKWTREE